MNKTRLAQLVERVISNVTLKVTRDLENHTNDELTVQVA
jgi:hypothetical protein